MQKTLQQILEDIGAYIDQDTTLPTGTEETVRINLINQAQDEWASAYQWEALRMTHTPTFAYSGVSFALPANFKKTQSPVYDKSQPPSKDNEYQQLRDPDERFLKQATDKYFYTTGDHASGYAMVINPALDSGASIQLDFQAHPSSMATLQDIAVCPQPEFLVKRVSALILESRSDARFPQLKAEAEVVLQRMIEEEMTPAGGTDFRVTDWPRRDGFTLGE